MSDYKPQSWLFPKQTGDVGRDRNAWTIQSTCLLFAFVLGAVSVVDTITGDQVPPPILAMAVGLAAAAIINRTGRAAWAARIIILVMLSGAILLVLEAHDGFRSHAMLVFPGLLLISVMLLDRGSYLATAAIVLLAVVALGIAEIHGLTGATPEIRTPTSYESIFYVDLTIGVFAVIGSRIAGDGQRNILDLHDSIERLSVRNLELIKSSKALGKSEERFRATFYQAAVGIAQTGIDGRWTLLNDQFCEMLGYSQAELSGKTFLDVTHPDDREASLNAVRRLLAGDRSSWNTEKRYIRKDGTTVWARLFTSLVRGERNEPQYFIAVVEDITEKINAERALRDTEQRLKLAQSAAHLGVWHRELGTHIITFSGEYACLYGLAPDQIQITHEEWLSLIHPDDRERVQALALEARERTHIFDAEFRVVWADGGVHWLQAKGAVLSNDSGHPICATGVTMDITQRKNAEAALRESEARLKNAERLAHVGNWHWDIQANRVTWSEEMFRIFGKPKDYTPNYDSFFQDLIPRHRERVERAIRDGLAGKGGNLLEFQITLPDGDVRTISTIGEVLESEGGLPTRMFGACQDITDIRRAQETVLARQKLESVGALATGIAHDFNNLLGGVLAQADLALQELADGMNPEEELKGIREGAIRGSEIVRQLMVYSGKESEVPELVDISRIVEDMLDLLRISISKHAALDIDLGKNLPNVRANAAPLRQIVMNLVTNATEAIGERDGVISVKTGCVTVGRDSPGATSDQWATADYLRLEVSDTGSGIPSQMQARVFDPFFTTKSAGRGLGLAVVHGIVESLGGMIRLESEVGKGTKLQILLPCAEAAAKNTNPPTARTKERAHLGHGTILVVEDEDPLRRSVSKMFQKVGFNVLEASNGDDALKSIRTSQTRIDILLLDVTLPGAPSRQVFEQASRLRPEMKVIVTSAYSKETAAASLTGKVEHFIRKPYQLGDLMDRVQQSLS